jgi:hypothetical protein
VDAVILIGETTSNLHPPRPIDADDRSNASCRMGDEGFELTAQSSGKMQVSDSPCALRVQTPPDSLDPDLARLVALWPTLPEALRAGIIAMVEARRVSR